MSMVVAISRESFLFFCVKQVFVSDFDLKNVPRSSRDMNEIFYYFPSIQCDQIWRNLAT